MTKIRDVYNRLCEIAPLSQQLEYDNSGFQIGHLDAPVSTILFSLDITDDVAQEAVDKGAQLIVSHHPLIWNAIKSLTDCEENNRKILKLIENKIAVISMHTNLDIASGGVNDVLLSRLGARFVGYYENENCGRMGKLDKPMPMQHFLALCKEVLGTNALRYHDAGRAVEQIAVMGGSGGSSLLDAYRSGCDTLLTADVKYSVFLLAKDLGINLIDADHFCTENPVISVLANSIQTSFPDISVLISQRHGQTVHCF